VLRDDWQILGAPALVLRIVLLRLRLAQDVTKEPGDAAILRCQVAIVARDRAAQALPELAPDRRFLGYI